MRATRVMRRLVIAASCLAVAQLSPAQPSKPLYDGAARLFSLHDVTVVYPAGPASDGETHRLSAERRAGFLRAVHGLQVEVAPDDSVSPQQLQGNLLLLGWGNRLLPADAATRPIVEADDGRRFLGEMRIAPGDDLLFAWSSPYNPKRLLVFWSRIDLELDRFMALPFVPSDWALYRDFLILGQGMFADGDAWPPERNPYGERAPVERRRPAASHSSAHYRLHGSPRFRDAVAQRILAAREAAWARAVQGLGEAPEELRIELFVYRDHAQMLEQSGVRDRIDNFSIPARAELHMTQQAAERDNPHEDIHLLARALLGPATLSVMFEGLAVLLEQGNEERELAMYAAAMIERGRAPAVSDLLDEERQRALVREGVGLGAAGLFVRWLRANADDATFRKLYTLRTGDADKVAALLGLETAAMENAFAAWLAAQAKTASADYAHSMILAEARRLGAAGDRQGELAALARAGELRADDPDTLYLTSLAQLRGGDLQAAEETLKRLLSVTASQKGTATHVLGVYRLGQALDGLGRQVEALERFESLLGLPDLHDSHRLARMAIETIKNRESGD